MPTSVALLDAARSLISVGGVEAVTVQAVTKAAGVAQGSLYSHYIDLDDLRAAALAEEVRDVAKHLCEALLTPPLDCLDLQGRVRLWKQAEEAIQSYETTASASTKVSAHFLREMRLHPPQSPPEGSAPVAMAVAQGISPHSKAWFSLLLTIGIVCTCPERNVD